jgi:hypothetical protein
MPSSTPHQRPNYNHDLEMKCAQDTITKIYDRSEQFGSEFMITKTAPSDAWNYYLGCVLRQNNDTTVSTKYISPLELWP